VSGGCPEFPDNHLLVQFTLVENIPDIQAIHILVKPLSQELTFKLVILEGFPINVSRGGDDDVSDCPRSYFS
jgi:hypothetical protein